MTRASAKPIVLPITLKQRQQLDIATHPDCSDDLRDRWNLPTAHLMEPHIDVRRLRRAIMKLRARHDVLRLRFERIKNDWRAFIDPPGEDIVRVVDLGDMDDATFKIEIAALVNAPLQLVSAHLFKVLVAKCGGRGDVLIVQLHHTITDGYGMVVLSEDLTKYLIGLPVIGKAVTFAEYLTRFDVAPSAQAKRNDAFWKEMHCDFPKAPNVGRKGKGLVPNHTGILPFEQRQIDVTAQPKSIRRFETNAVEHNISPAKMIFTAHLEALCQSYDLDRLAFFSHVARMDPALDAYVGDHTLDPIFVYTAAGSEKFMESCKAVNEMMSQGLAHLPSDTARRGGPYQSALLEAGGYPDQFSLYEPRAVGRQNKSVFREGFNAGYNVPQKIGAYTLTQLKMLNRRRSSIEMQLNLGESAMRTGFSVHFDGVSYTFDEMRTLCRKTCDLLGFEKIKMDVW